VLNKGNMSAMILKTNGKESSSNRTKHVNVRYFFIKDRIGAGEITLKHCPTGEILGNHFTKPVQVNQFRKMRSEIKGIPEDTPDALMGWYRPCIGNNADSKHGRPSLQECGGTRKDRTNAGTTKGAVSLHANENILHADGKVLATRCSSSRSYDSVLKGGSEASRALSQIGIIIDECLKRHLKRLNDELA
jgi:hypothetical protein